MAEMGSGWKQYNMLRWPVEELSPGAEIRGVLVYREFKNNNKTN